MYEVERRSALQTLSSEMSVCVNNSYEKDDLIKSWLLEHLINAKCVDGLLQRKIEKWE